jgi:hypothetical protein
MNKHFSSLCTPAKIYFILAVISSVIGFLSGVKFMSVAINLIIAFFWTFILGWLCQKGFKLLSWFLVLLPYLIILLAMTGIYRATQDQKEIVKMLHL